MLLVYNAYKLVYKMKIHEIYIDEPWFTYIIIGAKTIEARKYIGGYRDLKVGDKIRFVYKLKECKVIITKLEIYHRYEFDPLTELLVHEGINNCLPNINTLSNAQQIYGNYLNMDEIEQHGVIAIHFNKI